MPGSKIFIQNKALGLVSNHIPAAVRYFRKRKENVIVTCTGKSLSTFNTSLRLICNTPWLEDDITAVASDTSLVHMAAGTKILSWRSSQVVRKTFVNDAEIHLLRSFGAHLISVDAKNVLKVWDIATESVFLEIPFDADRFRVSAILHPPTYTNKILVASEQGGLQLWNVKKAKIVHTFAGFDSKVTVLKDAPAPDIVAVGLQNGEIVLLNIKFEEVLIKFSQDCGSVSSLAFRSDGPSILVSGSSSGNVNIWDLSARKLLSVLSAHEDVVSSLECFPSEPIMFSASPDNSIKLWIFDMPDGGPRLLRRREGHAAPPLCIRYHGGGGRHIVSSGEDCYLRIFNTVSETLNRSFGRATFNKKASKKNRAKSEALTMSPIVNFTTETTRDRDWDSIAAIHRDYQVVTTWSYNRCTMGNLRIVPGKLQESQRKDYSTIATCLFLTHCGNFVLVGYSSGDLFRFNIQSGIERAQYGSPRAHETAVKGVAVDVLNQMVISGGQNGHVRFWSFKPSECLRELELGESISFFRQHQGSSLLGVALDDFSVDLIDCDTKNLARRFTGAHKARLTDICFSPDGRWLLTSGMDAVVKVYDIPSSYLIDHFRVDTPVVSMAMSPTADFLATAHVDSLGICLWTNKALFNHVSLRALKPESEPYRMTLSAEPVEDNEVENAEEFKKYETPLQLSFGLLTLSDLPVSRWANLLNLDVCKKRNKPRAVKHAPRTSFFLPTIAGLDLKFSLESDPAAQEQDSKVLATASLDDVTNFGRLLRASTDQFEECVAALIKMNVSAVDFEIKSLAPVHGGSPELFEKFLRVLLFMLQSNLYFELAQSYLSVFLKSHFQQVMEHDEMLGDLLEEVMQAQETRWQRLEDKFLYGRGVVGSLKNFVC